MICSDVEIGKRIANLRKKCEMTQNRLAESVGLSRPILAKIETGSQPLKPDQLYNISRALHVTSDFLLSGVATENVTVSDDLGLSQSAIESMKMLKKSYAGADVLSAVNLLLETDEGKTMLETIFNYLKVDFSSAEYNLSVTRFNADGEMLRTDYSVPHPIEQLTFKNGSGDGIEIPVSMLRFAMLEAVKNSLNTIRRQIHDGGGN